MLSLEILPKRTYEDLREFEAKGFPFAKGKIMRFEGVPGYDVYNTTIPFEFRGRRLIAGRVEERRNEHSRVMLFEQKGDGWELVPGGAVIHNLQDPFLVPIGDRLLLGGVYTVWDHERLVTYRTRFYWMEDIDRFDLAAEGPAMMKDIRLLPYPDSRIAVFTRPQGNSMKRYGRVAAIGFGQIESIDKMTPEWLENLPLLKWHFSEEDWGGFNQLLWLKNGLIGCLGHKSWGETVGDTYVVHYYCTASAINPATRGIAPMQIIATRKCFQMAKEKSRRTADVCFPSGIVRQDGKALLYVGLSDSCEGVLETDDPFVAYEKEEPVCAASSIG